MRITFEDFIAQLESGKVIVISKKEMDRMRLLDKMGVDLAGVVWIIPREIYDEGKDINTFDLRGND